ncbi:MAG: preprotein translocase subunit SecA [Brachybacterium tyrofermentans]|uniref:Protein translocase subunit SecA n=1 Tax=Brachybacterium tyrofermentans TaxID=47848 RepID=A0ABW0FC02_9MICO|nr:preprotein translocase subunit SecA [Brachybacterium tyrofermentans]SLN02575.1 Protein export cytoplasm protein SecA ATPase RNA helicase (TC 3.A.5.1.1) [Corynebacterium xerosis]
MVNLFDKILRAGEGREVRRLESIAKKVGEVEDVFTDLSDDELREETDRFKERLEDGETLDDVMIEAFAAVREAAQRTLGQRPYDVQIMGGAALHRGRIAEMKTGEGKTLVATLPAYLNALSGKGVHVVTVNDYLAGYQSDIMGRVFRSLGLTTGVIKSGMTPAERREQYAADITYGTNNEFGFDYLRDNMSLSPEDRVQRGHNFVIVDEVDSILIDEARTPLIISGPGSGDANKWFSEFAKVVKLLRRDRDYEVDEKKRTVGVLESGIDTVEDHLGIDNLYESLNTPLIGFLNNAIKAKELFKRDKDYVIINGEVMIVDEHTGRILAGRRYNEGMHQAIEAKEGVKIKAENQTLATITLQNYFKLYEKLSGMTGTAETEAAEFMNTYKLGVVPIPTHREMQRDDEPDRIYRTEKAKFDAVVEDIVERHDRGQPVLVGTTSVEKSEYLAKLLSAQGVKHEVLNAKNHAGEAAIIAMAGAKGAVTVATNMAGRGTDIMLGGNVEFMAHAALEERGLDAEEDPEGYEAAWDEQLEKAKAAVAEQHDEVVELGGLYVLGTERHESRRIDNQLRGRSGRQGDPGESRFYLSLQDDLMRLFNSGAAESLLARGGVDESVPLTGRMVSGAIQRAQNSIESRNAEIRKNVLKYDDVLTKQRKKLYEERGRILEGEELDEHVERFIDEVIGGTVESHTKGKNPEDFDFEELWGALRPAYPVSITADELIAEVGGKENLGADLLKEEILGDARVAYETRVEELGDEGLRQLQRRVLLSVMDRRWREHLYEMDYLKEGIGLRAMAQRDPLIEYEREGHLMFNDMIAGIKEDVVGYIYNLEVQVEKAEPVVPKAVSDLLQAGTGKSKLATALAQATSGAGASRPASAESATTGTTSPVEDSSEKPANTSSEVDEEPNGSAGESEKDSEESSASDPLDEERSVVLTAKGLDDGPNSRQLRYSSAEGSGVQDDATLSRAQRRRRAKQSARVDSAAADKTSDKPEGAPVAENRGPRRGRRRKS